MEEERKDPNTALSVSPTKLKPIFSVTEDVGIVSGTEAGEMFMRKTRPICPRNEKQVIYLDWVKLEEEKKKQVNKPFVPVIVPKKGKVIIHVYHQGTKIYEEILNLEADPSFASTDFDFRQQELKKRLEKKGLLFNDDMYLIHFYSL